MKGFKEGRSYEEQQNQGTHTPELLQIWLHINYPLVSSYSTCMWIQSLKVWLKSKGSKMKAKHVQLLFRGL